MKKTILMLGAVLTGLLMVSTVTAVPKTNSDPAMNIIEKIEEKQTTMESLENKIYSVDSLPTNGIIDTIIQILNAILDFIQTLIVFIMNLFQIVSLISAIISAINQLISLINQLIQVITDIFTPGIKYHY